MTAELDNVSVESMEVSADNLDTAAAAAIYREHGCLVVRGLMADYIDEICREIDHVLAETIDLITEARQVPEGWSTPNGALLLPAPKGFPRDKQIMCLPISYRNSAVFFRSALDTRTLDLVEAVLGPNIELFHEGQSLVKEAVGGHPKHLHQDASYFEHRFEGPMGQLNYAVDTDLQNGALYVVPGSFRMGLLEHEDTFSHLGLNGHEWPWERAMPIEGKAGDSIFFHVNCIHGSKPNWSDKPRPVFINRYRTADDYVVVGATSTENRKAAEAQREQATKDNQRGLMVRGFRAFDSNR